MSIMTAPQQEFYTIDQVAMTLQISRDTVSRFIDKGELPAYKVGKQRRIKKSDFDAFMEKRKEGK